MSLAIAAQSIPDVAASTGISRSTLYQLIQHGRGPRAVRVGRRLVVLVEDRDKWLQGLACGAGS